MERWKATLRVSRGELKVLIGDGNGDDILRARLPLRCDHPRALLTLLEAMAMWSGRPLRAATSADEYVPELFGDFLYPVDSALVRFELIGDRAPRRIRGLGDFRDVLAVEAKAR